MPQFAANLPFFDVLIDVLGSIAHKFAIHLFGRDLWETVGHFSSQALTPTSTRLCPPICFPFEAFLVHFFQIPIWLLVSLPGHQVNTTKNIFSVTRSTTDVIRGDTIPQIVS